MTHPFFQWLARQTGLQQEQLALMQEEEKKRPFSLFREVHFLMYAGILVFTAGLGILIYENIGSIGHILLILGLFTASGLGFWKSLQVYPPFGPGQIPAPSLLFHYMVLGSVMLFLVGEGYLEYRFSWFENHYRILGGATSLFCFFMAYRFDHQGVLTIAISTLAATVGISILPQKYLLQGLETLSQPLAMTELVFGMVLLWAGFLLARRQVKPHFESVFASMGATLMAVAIFYLQLYSTDYGLFTLLAFVWCGGLFVYARRLKSVYLYLLVLGTGYFTLTYAFFGLISNDILAHFFLYYCFLVLGSLAWLLIKYKKILRIQ